MNFRSRSPLVQPVRMRGSVQGFGFGFPDIEEQSMLAAKTGAKAKTVSDGFRKIAVRQQLQIQFMIQGWFDGADELFVLACQTQVSVFMQQHTGSHHSVSA